MRFALMPPPTTATSKHVCSRLDQSASLVGRELITDQTDSEVYLHGEDRVVWTPRARSALPAVAEAVVGDQDFLRAGGNHAGIGRGVVQVVAARPCAGVCNRQLPNQLQP